MSREPDRVEDALAAAPAHPARRRHRRGRQFTIEQVACLGCCTLAPVVKMGDCDGGIRVRRENAADQVRDISPGKTAADGAKSTEEMEPPGTSGSAQIRVGLGSCCMAKGSDQLFHALRESAGQCGGQVGHQARRLHRHVPSHPDD